MEENKTKPNYDLEQRTYKFAKDCRDYVKKLPRTISNIEYGKQLIRSSGSVAANYIEANESISPKDFVHRIKICRKESKESRLWINLSISLEGDKEEQSNLAQEALELTRIFGTIVEGKKEKK